MPVPIVCLTLGLGCLMPSCFATAPPEAPDAVDGRYIYFAPYRTTDTNYHGEVMRYDTSGDFSDTSYWSTFDPSDHGVSNGRGGYCEGAFDGRHVYFVPNRWGWPHGQVLRFDTLTYSGDVDHDGDVDLSDLAQLLGQYGLTSGAICEDGDLDADGGINLSDLAALLGAYGTSCN